MVPTQTEFQADEPDFTPPTQSRSTNKWTQDHEDGQWRPAPLNKDNPQTSSFVNTHDEGYAREVERADLMARYAKSPAQPGHECPPSATMFAKAQINEISGGTFNMYEPISLAPGRAPMLQFAGLAGLQVASIATHYLHCNHPQVALPPAMASMSSVSDALHFPSPYHEMKIMGSFTLWLWFIKMMWTQQRTIRHH
ncbi:hypothetical protein D9619_002144 [Psilocybe cf. subviscida]|uniref:Uncharacterized protein n=1 Tax=Psilocybe cf. subviscida TaxID=2480587 RepID=A0A8H5BEH4_9AGAR|nr:hypothetical protein D9619_002144 [Psilocybe cf. subviscida]